MSKRLFPLVIFLLMALDTTFGATRVAYTRPGIMMKIPFSTVGRSPYLFRTGFGTEFHNLSPFNSTAGIFFDMEVGKNFSVGFSSVQTRLHAGSQGLSQVLPKTPGNTLESQFKK